MPKAEEMRCDYCWGDAVPCGYCCQSIIRQLEEENKRLRETLNRVKGLIPDECDESAAGKEGSNER